MAATYTGMILAMFGHPQPAHAATTKTTRKKSVKLAFICSPRHRSAQRGGGIISRFQPTAQGENKRAGGKNKEHDHRWPCKPTKPIACYRPVEVFLHQVAQDQPENHGRPGITKTAHKIAQDTERDHDQKIYWVAVDAEGSHENEDEHEGNHERVAHLGELGELCRQNKPNEGTDDSRHPLNPNHAKDDFGVLLKHFRARQISPR